MDQTEQHAQQQGVGHALGLWELGRGQRLRYGGAILAIGLSNVGFLLAPIVAGSALDALLGESAEGRMPALAWLALAWPGDAVVGYLLAAAVAGAALVALGSFFMYLRGRWAAVASETIAQRMRDALYRRLHHLPASFFDTENTGDLVQRCSSDVETVRRFLSGNVVEIGRCVLMVLAMAPILFQRHAQLAAFATSLMPFIAIGAFAFFSRVKRQFQVADEAEGAMTAVLQENLAGIRVVRAFARQEHEMARFGARSRAYRDSLYRVNALEAVYWGITHFLTLAQIGIVLIVGGTLLAAGAITVGDLFAFVSLVGMVVYPVRRLGEVLTDSGKAVIALGRVNHILGAAEESRETTPQQPRARGEIVFERVRAGYKPDRAAVVDFSATIPAGQTVGIVGPPGSGKTTLMRLLLRLYPFHAGRILVDGLDVRQVDRHWLRLQIGVVMQEPFLYSRSIAANLRVAQPDAPDARLEDAAREAAIHDAIVDFPAGYGAQVGERGITLSGGQRQRLALARALLKDPPILVLDDSLSAVDTGTERRILEALARRRGRHTTIVIAHRLSSVQGADRILVLERGRLVQDGRHDELAVADGPYRRLCEIQGLVEASIQADAAGDIKGAAHGGGG